MENENKAIRRANELLQELDSVKRVNLCLIGALESIEADINKHLSPGSQSTFMTLVGVMSAQRKVIRAAIAKAKGDK